MNGKRYKELKKLYGRKIKNWPIEERAEGYAYRSIVSSKIAVAFAILAVTLNIINLILRSLN